MRITESGCWPKTLSSVSGSWSVSVPLRSRTSADAAGVVGARAPPSAMLIRRNGTPMKNSVSPTKTPAKVRRNCFIEAPTRESPLTLARRAMLSKVGG